MQVEEVLERLGKPDFSNSKTNEYLTHNLHDRFQDPVITRILSNNLNNGENSPVKILFAPVYLDGTDGIFNMQYYEFLTGCDLTIFPSLYEPWGYTPLESIAFQVNDIIQSMEDDSGIKISELKVDGGAAANDMLMQFTLSSSTCTLMHEGSNVIIGTN